MDDAKKLKRAIRAKCLDCSGSDPAEVALCKVTDCPLHPYRVDLQASFFAEEPDEPEGTQGRGKKAAEPAKALQFKLI